MSQGNIVSEYSLLNQLSNSPNVRGIKGDVSYETMIEKGTILEAGNEGLTT